MIHLSSGSVVSIFLFDRNSQVSIRQIYMRIGCCCCYSAGIVDEIAISTRGGEKQQRDKEDGSRTDKGDSAECGTTALARDEDDQLPEATAGGGGGSTVAGSQSKAARVNARKQAARRAKWAAGHN